MLRRNQGDYVSDESVSFVVARKAGSRCSDCRMPFLHYGMSPAASFSVMCFLLVVNPSRCVCAWVRGACSGDNVVCCVATLCAALHA